MLAQFPFTLVQNVCPCLCTPEETHLSGPCAPLLPSPPQVWLAYRKMPLLMARSNFYMFLTSALYIQISAIDTFYIGTENCIEDGPHFSQKYYITYAGTVAAVFGAIGVAMFQVCTGGAGGGAWSLSCLIRIPVMLHADRTGRAGKGHVLGLPGLSTTHEAAPCGRCPPPPPPREGPPGPGWCHLARTFGPPLHQRADPKTAGFMWPL